MTDDIFADTT